MPKKTVNMTLRLPADLAPLVNQAAQEERKSRHQFIVDVLYDAVARDDELSPGLVLGFVQLVNGEVDPNANCPRCQAPFAGRGVYVGFTTGSRRPQPFGPVCGECVIATKHSRRGKQKA